MTSACAAFSQCRIQFIGNGNQRADQTYSDRSLIELRQHDFANYTLRALDIENNKKEIFNIPLENENQYKQGRTDAQPDEIETSTGTFRLWLNVASRTKFREALDIAIQEIKLLDPQPNPTSTKPSARRQSPEVRRDRDDDPPRTNQKRDANPPRSTMRRDDDDDDPPRTNPKRDTNPPKRSMRRDDDDDDHPPRTNPKRDANPPRSTMRRDDDDDPPRTNQKRDTNPPRTTMRHDNDDDDPPRTNPKRDANPPGSTMRRNDDDDRPSKLDLRPNEQLSRQTSESYQKDIFVDVYQLGEHIRQGHTDQAVDIAERLADHHVSLQVNVPKDTNQEKPIPIRVKIDSNDKKISRKYDDALIMNVYPSTTIGDLRTSFEYLDHFPPSNQYLFVHGHLAHENSTMKELNIAPNSLFVLFIIQQ